MPLARALPVLALAASACVTLGNDLTRAELLYEEARYESALVWLRDLERDEHRLQPSARTTFHYLRGMTSLRLGMTSDALHFLALARELHAQSPLRPRWKQNLDRALSELLHQRQ